MTNIIEWFEEKNKNNFDRIAIRYHEKKVSYGEIFSKVNDLSNEIYKETKRENCVVAIFMERGIDLLISMLSILKAGTAFLLINPKDPEERIQHMLKDCHCSCVITNEREKDNPAICGRTIIVLSDDQHLEECKLLPEYEYKSENLGYVMYTSGSTGLPKGIMVEQKSLINLCYAMKSTIEYKEKARVLSATNMSFDVFIAESLFSLCYGFEIIMADENERITPRILCNMIEAFDVDVIYLTPTMLQMMFRDSKCHQALNKVGMYILAGERLPENLLKEVKEKTNARIYNLYGPTETTIYVTWRDLTNRDHVDIGIPFENVSLYIMDEEHNVLDFEQQGELCIGGVALARGYIENDTCKNDKFLYVDTIGQRIYKTGDIVKRTKNGDLLYLGRKDSQVKVNGNRIELEEIEKCAEKAKDSGRACAMVVEENGRKEIVLFCTQELYGEQEKLREYLRTHLPSYMIPKSICKIRDFPMSVSGKVDREKLLHLYLNEIKSDESDADKARTVKEYIVNRVQTFCQEETIDLDKTLNELGFDSVQFVSLLVEVEEKFDMEFSDEILYLNKNNRVKNIIDFVSENM